MIRERFAPAAYVILAAVLLTAAVLALGFGSTWIPPKDVIAALFGGEVSDSTRSIVLTVRLPRVLCAALCGAALSLCGAAMQGLLHNPLADGSTLGVSSGASLGAVLALAFGLNIPGLRYAGTMGMAMVFAFGSLALILCLAAALDRTISTHSIILIGVIFSMFASALINIMVTFAGERVKSIMFWTMGSFASARMDHAAILSGALLVCGGVILAHARALNAFAVGEENARAVGVNVRRVRLTVMIVVSMLIGVCVSVGGTIAFVGLVTPHMARLIVGPNHRKLLPASLFAGATFTVLADVAGRTLLSPRQLPVGVVTSLVGAAVFVVLLRVRKGAA